jgi:YD repeat-containing protein
MPERPEPRDNPAPPSASVASGAPRFTLFLPLVTRNYDPTLISPRGGAFSSPDGRVIVTFPPGAVDRNVRVRYEALLAAQPEGFAASVGNFSLEAVRADDGRPVKEFGAPLEIRARYDDPGLPRWLEQRLHLYYRDLSTGRWEVLPSVVDPEGNVVTGWTTHFTDFGLLAQGATNPCDQAVLLAPAIPPATAPSLPHTFYNGVVSFDYYTGTQILLSSDAAGTGSLYTRDHARITAFGPGGGTWEHAYDDSPIYPQEVSRILFPNAPFSATYSIQTVLWTQSYITYSSSAYYLTMKDVTPPQISGVAILPLGRGEYYLEATVVDNCAVASVHLVATSSSGGGASAAMGRVSGDRYGAGVRLRRAGRNTFTITAKDAAGNSSRWSISLSSIDPESLGFSCLKGPCGGHQGTEGDPVNTASGNFVTRTLDLRLPGIGNTEIRVERVYNAQAVPPQGDFTLIGMDPGPFGPGWSWPFDFYLEFVDNLLFQGVKVHYPDGHTARFRRNPDGSFSPVTPGNTDRFQAVPGGYILQQKDLTRYRFDPDGRLVEVQDPNGNTQTLTYNGAGQLVRVENSAGRWIELAYTPEGLIREITAPEGVRLQYAYTDGLLTAFTDARGQTWHYTYNSQGWLTAIISPKGHPILQLRYGENPDAPEYGRVIEQIEGATARRTFSYDDPSHTRTVRDAYGHPTVHQYDEDYRLIRLTDPLGDTEEYGYDDRDRRVFFKDKEGREWHYLYDERGNLIREDGPLGWERAWEYNGMDRLTMERDPAGRRTFYGYDDRGNLIVITNALGFTRTFTYDARGLPIRLTDFNGNVVTNTYDAAGNLIAVENGVGALTRYAYDGLGRTVAMTTPNGAVFTYTYDAGSPLLTGAFGPLGYREAYEYDPNGNLARKVDPNGNATRYEYDDSDRLMREINALGYTTVYTYGLMNERTAMQDPEGRVTAYEYDALLRLIAVHAPEGATSRYAYDGVGNLIEETDPEGRVTRYVYNDLDRLVERVRNYVPGGPRNADTNVSTHYEYDPAGNLIRVVDPNGTVTCYEYDALNRLRAEIRNCRPGEPPRPDVNVTTRFEYDPNGNLIRRVNPRGFATVYAYDAADRLIAATDALSQTTTYAYDPDGNLIALTDPAEMTIRYEYDLLDRRTAEIRNFREGEPPGPDVNVTTRYEYDPAGNLIRRVDPNGIAACYEYDALNRLRAEVRNCRPGEPPGPDVNVTTRYEYDRVGNLLRLTDPNGHATRFAYDGLNRLLARTDPEGHTITFSYDRVGNLLRRVDARGFPTAYAYDALNRLISATDPLGGVTRFTYDPAGNLIARTDPNNHTTHFTYDGLYRLATVIDPEGFVTRSEYDPNGNRTALVDGNGHRTAFTYDPLDRLETVTNPEGETIRHVYDPVGNQTLRIEPDGVVTRYDYDGLYRLAAVTLNHRPGAPADRQTNVAYRYHYDPAGNRVQVDLPPNAAALTRTLRYEYDSLHRLVAETDPLGNTWRYAYDPAGNRVRRVDPAGRVTTYTYDADNLLVRIAYDDGVVIAFAYDENHNRTAMTDTLGVSRWAYDPLNRVVEATDSLGRRLRYAYDPAGNRVALTLPEGGILRYDYDASNRLREVTDPEGRRTRFERDGVGNLVRQVNPNGTVTEASYDRANRLRSLTTRRLDGTVIAAFAYEVNEVGLRTVMTATYGWRNPPVVTERYTYDPLRRLTGVTDSEGFRAVYEYDAAGNRTRWWANDDRTTPRPRDGFEVTYTYDAADQLLQALRVGAQPNDRQAFVYAYDANGNRVNLNWPGPPGPDTQGMDYVYDREGRLIVAQAYQTNHRGQRVDREVIRLFYDGLGRRLVKEYDPKTGAGGAKRTEYVLDDRDPVAEYFIWNGQREEFDRGGVEAFSPTPMLLVMRHFPAGAEGQAYWVHLDGRGSVAGITQHLGQSTHNYRYDAYGQVLPAQGNWTDPHNHYTFLGKEWDEHLGLYEFGVRLYDPWGGCG